MNLLKEPLNKPLPAGCGWLGRLSGRALTRDAGYIPRAEMPMAEFAVFGAPAKSTGTVRLSGAQQPMPNHEQIGKTAAHP